MHTKTLVMAAVFGALLAACDKAADKRADPAAPASRSESSAGTSAPQPGSAPQSSTPSTPANLPKPSTAEEKREGANPVQGQVDPKESEQRRDFQQRGASEGPTSAETQPRPSTGR